VNTALAKHKEGQHTCIQTTQTKEICTARGTQPTEPSRSSVKARAAAV